MIDSKTQHDALMADLQRNWVSPIFASFRVQKVRETKRPGIDHIPRALPNLKEKPSNA